MGRFFLFDIHKFILININRINSQKSWKPILRTFILQALSELHVDVLVAHALRPVLGGSLQAME